MAHIADRVQQEVTTIGKLSEWFEANLEDESTPIPSDSTQTRHRIIRLLLYLDPQHAAEHAIANAQLIPDQDHLVLHELASRTTMSVEELGSLYECLTTVQDNHDLNVGRKQTRNSSILSVDVCIFLPINFITGLFEMNVVGSNGSDNPIAKHTVPLFPALQRLCNYLATVPPLPLLRPIPQS